VADFEQRRTGFIEMFDAKPKPFGVADHGAELQHGKALPIQAQSLLDKNRTSRRFQRDRHHQDDQDGKNYQESHRGYDQVEDTLGNRSSRPLPWLPG
jgi:hypothetical protein